MGYSMLQRIGNGLILLSLLGFFYIYYPFLKTFVPQTIPQQTQKGTFIAITKINAYAPIIQDVNPWVQTEYTNKLQNGVAHAKGTAIPGEKGTIFLFSHSSEVPWRITQYNTVFFRLSELEKGDKIEIRKNGVLYKYIVREQKIVSPKDVGYLFEEKNQLILQTCYPVGTDFQRLLIFADPKGGN